MNLATWIIQATDGVNYVRAEMPAKHLPGKCIELGPEHVVPLDPLDLTPEFEVHFPHQEGAAIWMFGGNTTRAVLIAEMMSQGIPCFAEYDDNYTMPPDTPELSAWQLHFKGDDRYSYEESTNIAGIVDGVIVSTPHLADVYSAHNDNVHVCRNCVDPDDWDEPVKPDDGILRVGWAASDSHRYDAPLLKQAFRWLHGRPDVKIIVIGIQTASFPVPVKWVPWMNSLADYRRSLQQIDVMVCPLKRNPWADCKSDIKAMEGAMAGAMAVVSDSPAYDLWHDRTFVCDTQQSWEKALKHLYRNRDEVRELQAAHRKYVMEERTIAKGVEAWRDAITSSSRTRPANSSRSAAVGSATSS